MKNLSQIAIEAYELGSDNFGEIPTGSVTDLCKTVYKEGPLFIDTDYVDWDYYSCTVSLRQSDGHLCTSGVGFYVKNNMMDVCSGHIVFTIPVTDDIQAELNDAVLSCW